MIKKTLLKGLTAVLAFLFVVMISVTMLGYENAGLVDQAMGIGTGQDNAQNLTAENTYYKSEFGDGTLTEANQKLLVAAEDEYRVREQEEGSVLLRNENSALPLDPATEKKITLFGSASAKPVGGQEIDLYDALKEAGFEINDTLYNAYKDSPTKRSAGNEYTKPDIGEEDKDFYTPALKDTFQDYNDVAVVVIARYNGEGTDMAPVDADGVPQMSFHQSERDMMDIVKSGGFKKIVVLVNSAYAYELDWLDEYDVDACLWVGDPGSQGFKGVANILTGKANPSGKLVDTYAADCMSSAAAQNYYDYTWANYNDIKEYSKANGGGEYNKSYLIQAEGIYIGYKYYETRYEDCILGQGNAANSAGVYASKNNAWNYADEVTFPFGYGLSYTEFSQELVSVDWDREAQTVTAEIKVTNIGDVAGKSVVQLYVQTPYTDYDRQHNVEKSAIQLLDFGKTALLAPGDEETITINAEEYLFASYDNDGAKGYILDGGDYYFAIGNDVHDALNNVLAAKGATGMVDPSGAAVDGDKSKAAKETLDALDTETYKYSRTGNGTRVTNQFDDINFNYYCEEEVVTYMTRSDWTTFPKEYTDLSAPQSMFKELNGKTYTKPADAPEVSSFKQNEKVTVNFIDLYLERDKYLADTPEADAAWEAFLNQFSIGGLCAIYADGYGLDADTTVNRPHTYHRDSVDKISGSYMFGGSPKEYASSVVMNSTWNKELIKERAKFFAEDALFTNTTWNWGAGYNLHRTPFGGRNVQYCSEDSVLTYISGSIQVAERQRKGLISGIKHFSGNDQETNRMGIATFFTEQAFRENNLRAFEGAVNAGALGMMTSYNRVGATASPQKKALLTNVLRDEWGFKGMLCTDAALNTKYEHTAECVDAGIDMFCIGGDPRAKSLERYIERDGDGHLLEQVRLANKHCYYAFMQSNLVNGLDKDFQATVTTSWWKIALIALDCVLGVGALGCAGAYVFFTYFRKNEKEGYRNENV